MTRLEELKHKRKAALIGVCTLGLAGLIYVGVGNTWRDSKNMVQGSSFAQTEGLSFILKIMFFMFFSVLLAIPFFIISFIQLIYYSIIIGKEEQRQRLQQQYHNLPMGTQGGRANTIDIFSATYFYSENNQLYGPIMIEDLAVMDIRTDTALAVNHPNNWKYAGDIPDLIETLRYVQN